MLYIKLRWDMVTLVMLRGYDFICVTREGGHTWYSCGTCGVGWSWGALVIVWWPCCTVNRGSHLRYNHNNIRKHSKHFMVS